MLNLFTLQWLFPKPCRTLPGSFLLLWTLDGLRQNCWTHTLAHHYSSLFELQGTLLFWLICPGRGSLSVRMIAQNIVDWSTRRSTRRRVSLATNPSSQWTLKQHILSRLPNVMMVWFYFPCFTTYLHSFRGAQDQTLYIYWFSRQFNCTCYRGWFALHV